MSFFWHSNLIELSEEQKALLQYLHNSTEHIFVTGKAGSGKSTLLKEFKKQTTKRLVITAPTGIAALNAGGQTLHSLFQFDTSLGSVGTDLSKTTKELLRHLDVLVIDEISMVRADLMDKIDRRLRQVRRSNIPFGGVRLVMFGDLYQLPPIVSDDKLRKYLNNRYGGIYFFNAKVWQTTTLKTYELREVFRQKDETFKDILNEIRSGKISNQSLMVLNKRCERPTGKDGVITLAATNKVVNEVNEARLRSLTTKQYIYYSKDRHKSDRHDSGLRLKVGAQVMFTKNDQLGRWVNGSLGEVITLRKNRIRVKVQNKTHEVNRVNFARTQYSYNLNNNRIEEETENEFKQFPLKLAWAVTIHKSQGQTYSDCAIDLKHGVFTSGQAYVALSRVKSLDGLYLLSPIMKSDISVDESVVSFMKRDQLDLSVKRASNLFEKFIKCFKLGVFKSK